VVAARACFTLLLIAFLGACGATHDRAARQPTSTTGAGACTDRLPLDTPRPLILALHGAR
jgi:hypothetical protein